MIIIDLNGLRDFNQTLVVRGVAQGGATAAKTVSVKFLGTTITCRIGRDVTVAAGDIVLVIRQGHELMVVDRFHAAAPTGASDDLNSYPPNPWDSVRSGTSVIHPVKTRTYRDGAGWRTDTDDLFHGKWGSYNSAGCAFYGDKPKSLQGAEVLSARIKVKRDAGSDWSPHSERITLKRITQTNLTRAMVKDDTGPDFVSGTEDGPRLDPRESQNFTIPTSWGQSIVDGAAGGLAIHSNTEHPKARLDGRGSWGPSFTLTLTYRRVV